VSGVGSAPSLWGHRQSGIDAARGWSSEVTSCGRLDLKVGAKMMGYGAPPLSALNPRRLAIVVLVGRSAAIYIYIAGAGAKVP
jgi:hypothetical protein